MLHRELHGHMLANRRHRVSERGTLDEIGNSSNLESS